MRSTQKQSDLAIKQYLNRHSPEPRQFRAKFRDFEGAWQWQIAPGAGKSRPKRAIDGT
jgi:hypothetical protein